MQTQIDDLNQRLGTVTRLEQEKSQLLAGNALLTNQLVANRLVPVWSLSDNIAPRSGPGPGMSADMAGAP